MTSRGRAAFYAGLTGIVLLPGLWRAEGGVPGSPRSDLWDGLWTLWHFAANAGAGRTALLDAPDGGVILAADPLHAAILAPITLAFGAAVAWTIAVVSNLLLAAYGADALARDLGADADGALVAGASFATAPVLLSSIHNGNTESIAVGWLPLALLAIRRAMRDPTAISIGLAAVVTAVAGIANAYLAVATWIAAVLTIASSPGRRAVGLLTLGLATALVAPWIVAVQRALGDPESLVGIKDPQELALVRRTIGAADPLAFVTPGDFRSPDFRRISRYGEDFLHVPYLGWLWLCAAVLGLRTSRLWGVAAFGVVGLALACGPVLVHDGSAVLLPGNLGVPLPYFLIERLPGFSSLSLVWRLAVLPALAIALLASRAPVSRRWLALAGVVEILVASPMRGGPDAAPLPDPAPFRAIAAGPEGAVLNWPVEGGRPYLYEQTLHGRPLAATLNFPANEAARRVWADLRDRPGDAGLATARKHGIRWLVVHEDADAAPGPYDSVVSAIAASGEPYASGVDVRIYRLW